MPFPSIPAGFGLVAASLSDFNEFTLGGAGLGTIVIDQNISPVLIDSTHVRYAITGAFASAGTVTATFKHGTWSVTTPPATTATPDPAAPDETTELGRVEDPLQTFIIRGVAIDVPFPVMAGYQLDAASFARRLHAQRRRASARCIDTSVAPQVLGDGTTVRYRILGAFNSDRRRLRDLHARHLVDPRPGRRRLAPSTSAT